MGAIRRRARLVSLDGLSEQPCGLTSVQRGGEHLLMALGGREGELRERERGQRKKREAA